MSNLTKEELEDWARTVVRMLVNRLKVMLNRGEVLPNDPM